MSLSTLNNFLKSIDIIILPGIFGATLVQSLMWRLPLYIPAAVFALIVLLFIVRWKVIIPRLRK